MTKRPKQKEATSDPLTTVSFKITAAERAPFDAYLARTDVPPSLAVLAKACAFAGIAAKNMAAETMATGRPAKRRGT